LLEFSFPLGIAATMPLGFKMLLALPEFVPKLGILLDLSVAGFERWDREAMSWSRNRNG
jgi:hypothetical protein